MHFLSYFFFNENYSKNGETRNHNEEKACIIYWHILKEPPASSNELLVGILTKSVTEPI